MEPGRASRNGEKGGGFFMNQEQQSDETKYELCANKTIEACSNTHEQKSAKYVM